MLFINKLFNSIACLLYFINLQLVIPGRTWILLYLGRTVYKHLWACLALYKWPIPLGESMGIAYDVICTCACVHVHACAHVWGGTLSPPPPPSTLGGTPRISQNSITLELIKIFQFCLKIWNLWRLPHPWVGALLGGWVGWWVGSGQNTKNLKNLDLIDIIQFCLKIYDL